MDDKPVLRVEAEKREVVRVEIVGTVYEFRRPKTSATANDSLRALAARVAEINEQNSRISDDSQMVTMTEEETLAAISTVWRYLASAIVDRDDYIDLRRRMYGYGITDEQAMSSQHITTSDNSGDELFGPNPDDDLDLKHLGDAASALVEYWAKSKVAISNVKPPPAPQDHQVKKTARPGTTRTRKKTTARK